MKLQFKRQAYHSASVEVVADCFAGQIKSTGIQYRIDTGRSTSSNQYAFEQFNKLSGFKNADFSLAQPQILENIQAVQRRQNLTSSSKLVSSVASDVNLDIEMETGTGKTYCYIKTMFELHGFPSQSIQAHFGALPEPTYVPAPFSIAFRHLLPRMNSRNERPPIIAMLGRDCLSYSFDSCDSWYTMTPWCRLVDKKKRFYHESHESNE